MNEENSYSVRVSVEIYNTSRGGGLNVERRFMVKNINMGDIAVLLGGLDAIFVQVEQTLAGEKD